MPLWKTELDDEQTKDSICALFTGKLSFFRCSSEVISLSLFDFSISVSHYSSVSSVNCGVKYDDNLYLLIPFSLIYMMIKL